MTKPQKRFQVHLTPLEQNSYEKFKTLIAVAIIEGFTASTLKAADSDDLNVLDLLADNIVTLQNKEANTPPPA